MSNDFTFTERILYFYRYNDAGSINAGLSHVGRVVQPCITRRKLHIQPPPPPFFWRQRNTRDELRSHIGGIYLG